MDDNTIEIKSIDGNQRFKCSTELAQDMKDMYGIDIKKFVGYFLEYASKFNSNKNIWTYKMNYSIPDNYENAEEFILQFKFMKRS